MYGPKTLQQLEMIIQLQQAGLTLKEIQEALEGDDEKKIMLVNESIRRMKEKRNVLKEKISLVSQVMKKLEESLK